MKIYQMKVTLPAYTGVYRTIEIRADQTLAQLSNAILRAVGFTDTSHLYSFFLSGKKFDGTTEYTVPMPDGVEFDAGYFDGLLGLPPGLEVDSDNEDEDNEAEPHDGVHPTIPTLELILRKWRHVDLDKLDTAAKAREIKDATIMQKRMAEPGDVTRAQIGDLNLALRQKILYLFDFGDEWAFHVKVQKIFDLDDTSTTLDKYPRLVAQEGEFPEQYEDDGFDEFGLAEDGLVPIRVGMLIALANDAPGARDALISLLKDFGIDPAAPDTITLASQNEDDANDDLNDGVLYIVPNSEQEIPPSPKQKQIKPKTASSADPATGFPKKTPQPTKRKSGKS